MASAVVKTGTCSGMLYIRSSIVAPFFKIRSGRATPRHRMAFCGRRPVRSSVAMVAVAIFGTFLVLWERIFWFFIVIT